MDRGREHRADLAEPGAGGRRAQAKLFVQDDVDVIVAFEDQSIDAAEAATIRVGDRIPIVFLHPSDPLRDGLTKSLSRPGGNLTGVFGPRDVVAKQLEVYQALVPGLRRVLTLVDPKDPRTERALNDYESAAAQLQRPLELDIREATTAQDLKRIFRSLRPGEVDGAFLLSNNLRQNHSALTVELAKRARLPVQGNRKEWVEQGALFSYAIDLGPLGRAGARFVDSILRGTSPADLPVEEIPKIEFAINLKTASRLGHQAAAGDDHPGRPGIPVARSRPLGARSVEAPARPHRRLIWKYTVVVVTLVAAATVGAVSRSSTSPIRTASVL